MTTVSKGQRYLHRKNSRRIADRLAMGIREEDTKQKMRIDVQIVSIRNAESKKEVWTDR